MQILHRYTTACLWEGEASSMKEAVEKAVAEKANLRSANLRSANLRFANLRFANLDSADLRFADLDSADLRFANLRSANLRFADLDSANLRSADLPVKFPMCRMDFGGWSIWIREGETSIGCQTHSNENWLEWEPSDEAIKNMALGASEWWETYGPAVKATIRVIENQVAKIKE